MWMCLSEYHGGGEGGADGGSLEAEGLRGKHCARSLRDGRERTDGLEGRKRRADVQSARAYH